MAESSSAEDILARIRTERKDLIAKTQKMKRSVPKGDKKKKKDVMLEITQMLEELDMKHQKEMRENNIMSPDTDAVVKMDVTSEVVTLSSEETDMKVDPPESLEPGSPPQNTSSKKKVSKTQKRRNKKAQLEKDRQEAIAAQEALNLSGPRFLELRDIKKKLADRNLVIYEIPSDGNCLYKSIEHQLFINNVQTTTVECLRKETANYLLSHRDDFLPFLTDPESGDCMSEDQYTQYCDDVEKSCVWGGHIEIQALANIYRVPIEIVQAEGPCIVVGEVSATPKLVISYHRYAYGLGEHYNSVIPM